MLIALNKPYGVLSQFTDRQNRKTLATLITQPGVFPAGRLDLDSEGLLLLTDDGSIQQRLSHPRYKVTKTYLVQVEGMATSPQLERLRQGVELNDGPALPAQVQLLARKPNWLWPREPPIRYRRKDQTSWLTIAIREGRNRQVRRMTAAVGLPTLRLIRTAIGDFSVQDLALGQWQVIGEHCVFS